MAVRILISMMVLVLLTVTHALAREAVGGKPQGGKLGDVSIGPPIDADGLMDCSDKEAKLEYHRTLKDLLSQREANGKATVVPIAPNSMKDGVDRGPFVILSDDRYKAAPKNSEGREDQRSSDKNCSMSRFVSYRQYCHVCRAPEGTDEYRKQADQTIRFAADPNRKYRLQKLELSTLYLDSAVGTLGLTCNSLSSKDSFKMFRDLEPKRACAILKSMNLKLKIPPPKPDVDAKLKQNPVG